MIFSVSFFIWQKKKKPLFILENIYLFFGVRDEKEMPLQCGQGVLHLEVVATDDPFCLL